MLVNFSSHSIFDNCPGNLSSDHSYSELCNACTSIVSSLYELNHCTLDMKE